jgi:hypothetical protein
MTGAVGLAKGDRVSSHDSEEETACGEEKQCEGAAKEVRIHRLVLWDRHRNHKPVSFSLGIWSRKGKTLER